MEKLISVHSWVRSGASVYLCRVEQVDVGPGEPGQQITRLSLRIEAALSGPRGASPRTVSVVEPASATARLKFPAPVWGAVSMQKGAHLVVVTAELGAEINEPVYAASVQGPADPEVVALGQVLAAEASAEEPRARRARYLKWLSAGTAMERLFGGEALSRDDDLPDVDPGGEVAATFARVLGSEGDAGMRITLLDLAVPSVYERTNEAGRVALVGALFAGAADTSEDVRRAALDKLGELPEKDAELPGIAPVRAAAPHIEERILEEGDAQVKARLRRWLQRAR